MSFPLLPTSVCWEFFQLDLIPLSLLSLYSPPNYRKHSQNFKYLLFKLLSFETCWFSNLLLQPRLFFQPLETSIIHFPLQNYTCQGAWQLSQSSSRLMVSQSQVHKIEPCIRLCIGWSLLKISLLLSLYLPLLLSHAHSNSQKKLYLSHSSD